MYTHAETFDFVFDFMSCYKLIWLSVNSDHQAKFVYKAGLCVKLYMRVCAPYSHILIYNNYMCLWKTFLNPLLYGLPCVNVEKNLRRDKQVHPSGKRIAHHSSLIHLKWHPPRPYVSR